MGFDLYNYHLEYTFADDRMAELDRQLSFLLTTPEGTLPLDREFGVNMDYVDKPMSLAQSLYTAEITRKISKFIPAVRVREVTWIHSAGGTISPKVVITSA